MKVALIHDWLTVYAGAERVLNAFLKLFPQADLFTLIDFLPKKDRNFLTQSNIKTSFLQKMPGVKKYYRYYLPYMPFAVEQFDLSEYDLIISNSHAIAKGVITAPHQLHIAYIHSPMRYAWDLQHQYLRESNLTHGIKSFFARKMLHRLRLWDQLSANRPDFLISNSNFIRLRIQKTWRRQAKTIYPPVDLTLFSPTEKKENFFLAASRFVPYKKISLIVKTFSQLPNEKLVVIGDGPEFKKIQKLAPNNVELLGFQSTAVLTNYLQRAKAFIFAAEEDFGILPVEAQACATPVIAFGRGGACETVRGLDHPHPTGIFFQEQTAESLLAAIDIFEKSRHRFQLNYFSENIARFSFERFKQECMDFIQQIT